MAEDSAWVESELNFAEFGDRRLNKRGLKLLSALGQSPQFSLPGLARDWNECFAAYRFFDNEKVTHEKLISSHAQATLCRMASHEIVLAIHDSSSLNYSGLLAAEGLGDVGNSSRNSTKGLIMHSCYAVSPQRVPLGIISQKLWSREKSIYGESLDRAQAPISCKESMKWLDSMRDVSILTRGLDKTTVVHIMDREADIYQLFSEAESLQEKFIIRSRHNREINKPSRASRGKGENIYEALAKSSPLAVIDLEVPDRSGLDIKRQARVEVRALKFNLTAPRGLSPNFHKLNHESLNLTVVSVKEIGDREDELSDLIDWTLLTNVQIESADQVMVCIDYYCCRWQIEVFHRTLKTGCRVESSRLTSAKKLSVFVAMMTIVAWRIHWLSLVSRADMKTNPDVIFSKKEQLLMTMLVEKKKTLSKRKTANDYIIMLARLGGFLNRRGDGNPGPEVIWRGWRKLQILIADLETLKETAGTTYV